MPKEARDVLVFITVVILLTVLVVLVFTLLGDLGWCVDNYAPDDMGHCMIHENRVFGRYVQPELVCYSTEFR
jgi:hypothetical protein